MATFKSCIVEALGKGEIDAEAAEISHAAYDDAFDAASETFGPIEADRMAADKAMAKLEAEAIEARRRNKLTIRTRRAAVEGIAGLKTRRGYQGVRALGGADGSGKPPKGGWHQGGTPPEKGKPYAGGALAAKGLVRLIENKPGLAGAPFPSIEGRYRALRGRADAMMADLIEKFETRTGFDRPGRAAMENIVREAFGEDTGDAAAKGLAHAWSETAEWMRRTFNAAGGAIGKLDGWGMPQVHDAVRVREAGREAWVQAVLPRLDRAKMVDRATGVAFTPKRLEAVLGQVWETISTGGASKRQPGVGLGRGMLAKQRGEERFLAFKSADDWMAYQREFGDGDPFQAMMGHLDEMARDVAQMQILGPNPAHQFQWLADWAEREGKLEEIAGVEGAAERARSDVLQAERMLASFNGDASIPVNTALSSVGTSIRSGLTGVMLGSAVLGEVATGPVLGAYARAFTGLSVKGDMGQLMRLLTDPAERAIARRTGFIIEQATDGFVRASHDSLRLMTVGEKVDGRANAFARRLPAATMRLQGLTGLVAARKRSYRLSMMGALHDARDRTIADLKGSAGSDGALGRWLDARGFTEADWNIIRSTPAFEPRKGATFLLPRDVAHPELSLRLAEAIELETRLASPETTLWNRAMIVREKPGTMWGEITRSATMFKGFTATLTTLYSEEIALQAAARNATRKGALLMTAGLASAGVVFLTIAGAVNIQLREMAKGNDPRPMEDPKFWGAALSQGGGLGIAGDFLYAARARNGKSAPIAAFGPVGQLTADTWDATLGNGFEVANGLSDGEDLGEAVDGAHVGRDVSGLVRNYNPLSSLWWTRAAWNRAVADNVQRALDPDADEAFERRARRMEKETGQGMWWEQGAVLPGRAPGMAER